MGAAGLFGQCDHRSTSEATGSLRAATPNGSVAVAGLVERPGVIGRDALRSLAGSGHIDGFDARTVLLADFFGQARLHAGAELVMWHGIDGSRFVTPIGRLLDDPASTLLLGGSDQGARPQWTEPVVLRSTSLPDPGGHAIVAATALTFAQFVGGVR